MSKDIRENKEVKNELFKIPDQIFWGEKVKVEPSNTKMILNPERSEIVGQRPT